MCVERAQLLEDCTKVLRKGSTEIGRIDWIGLTARRFFILNCLSLTYKDISTFVICDAEYGVCDVSIRFISDLENDVLHSNPFLFVVHVK